MHHRQKYVCVYCMCQNSNESKNLLFLESFERVCLCVCVTFTGIIESEIFDAHERWMFVSSFFFGINLMLFSDALKRKILLV